MSDQLPGGDAASGDGSRPVDTRYTRFLSPPKMKPARQNRPLTTFGSGGDPFPSVKPQRRPRTADRARSVNPDEGVQAHIPPAANATFHARREAVTVTTSPADTPDNIYEPPGPRHPQNYGATKNSACPPVSGGEQNSVDPEYVYADGTNNDTLHQAESETAFIVVNNPHDGDGPSTTTYDLSPAYASGNGHYRAFTRKQHLARQCIFCCGVPLYTALVLIRIAAFVAIIVLGGRCLLNDEKQDGECLLYGGTPSPVSTGPTTVPPPPTTKAGSPTATTAGSTTGLVDNSTVTVQPSPLSTRFSPVFTSVRTIWLALSVLNSLCLCVFVLCNAKRMKLPQHRLLLKRLLVCKYFWTQVVLLMGALLYESYFLSQANKQRSTRPANEDTYHYWTVAGWLMSILDKIVSLFVVCYFNYAKPLDAPRTSRYLRWMRLMYMTTLLAYTLDQAFSVIYASVILALQVVSIKGYSVRSTMSTGNSEQLEAVVFLLLILSLAYRARLLEFFSDKIFYRNKDVFCVPRHDA